MIAARFFVSGTVQGVFFRAKTREQARKLRLSGHALNLPDGRVEVLAVGEPRAVDAMETWLAEGPRRATVESVEREEARVEEAGDGFEIG